MAQCVQSVQEFIQDSFVPLVAALCSEEAERLTRRNNLSFAELVKPFCRLTSEGRCRPWGRGRRRCSLPSAGARGRAGRSSSSLPLPAGAGPGRTGLAGLPFGWVASVCLAFIYLFIALCNLGS